MRSAEQRRRSCRHPPGHASHRASGAMGYPDRSVVESWFQNLLRWPASSLASSRICWQNRWHGRIEVFWVTNSVVRRCRLVVSSLLYSGAKSTQANCCGMPSTNGRRTAGKCAIFMSWEPPKVLPTLTIARTSSWMSSMCSIARGVPGTMFQLRGRRCCTAVLRPGRSITCIPFTWVRCQAGWVLVARLGRSLCPTSPQKTKWRQPAALPSGVSFPRDPVASRELVAGSVGVVMSPS